MTTLRAEKVARIASCIPDLEVEGCEDADLLIVGFGGTYGHLHSAMDVLNGQGKKVALAHLKYLNPLPKNTAEVLRPVQESRCSRAKTWDSLQAICV